VEPDGLSGGLISTQLVRSIYLLPFPPRVVGATAAGDGPREFEDKSSSQIIVIVVCDGVVE